MGLHHSQDCAPSLKVIGGLPPQLPWLLHHISASGRRHAEQRRGFPRLPDCTAQVSLVPALSAAAAVHQHRLAGCLRGPAAPCKAPEQVLHIADGQWHHVAFTWESSSGETLLYLDGKLVRPPHASCRPSAIFTCPFEAPAKQAQPSPDPSTDPLKCRAGPSSVVRARPSPLEAPLSLAESR